MDAFLADVEGVELQLARLRAKSAVSCSGAGKTGIAPADWLTRATARTVLRVDTSFHVPCPIDFRVFLFTFVMSLLYPSTYIYPFCVLTYSFFFVCRDKYGTYLVPTQSSGQLSLSELQLLTCKIRAARVRVQYAISTSFPDSIQGNLKLTPQTCIVTEC